MSAEVDPLAQIKQTYFQECDELLGDLERGLMALEGGDQDPETINLIFRAVHSIKGGAGAFGVENLVRFAHIFEETLDDIRSGKRGTGPDILKTLLAASDLLADLVREARDGAVVDPSRSEGVIARLSGGAPAAAAPVAVPVQGAPDPAAEDPFGISFQPVVIDLPSLDAEVAASRTYEIAFRPAASLYARAGEPAVLLRELAGLGEAEINLHHSEIPTLDKLEVEKSYLSWTISLRTEAGRDAITDLFSFVDGDCTLDIAAVGDGLAFELPAPNVAAVLHQIEEDFPAAASALSEPAPSAAFPANSATLTPFPVKAPPATAEDAAQKAPAQSIRVELERIDKLVDVVGELVINQAMLAQRIGESGFGRASSVVKGLEELEHLTRDLQESVMAIRAQPVRSVFQRMPRLVREVASMCGKEARLVTEGEGTEVDKTVIERLSDPITHMVRNAIDHGLEPTEKRVAAGKPAEGTVRLSAAHRSGRIVIEVSDDGGGIDRERVREIAIRKGVIGPQAQLTDDETDNLIFLPGFSTASKVSDISGRGVGMDVVRSSILALGGRISITSRPGRGSTFTMSLPLTLAVLDGMVVTVAGETLVVPLTAVVETLQPRESNLRRLGRDAPLVVMRDAYVPLLDVGLKLGYRTEPMPPMQGVILLVEIGSGQRTALLVDAIQGQRQVVIKSLEANYEAVPGIAAATILGNGRIALILDVEAVAAPTVGGTREALRRAAG